MTYCGMHNGKHSLMADVSPSFAPYGVYYLSCYHNSTPVHLTLLLVVLIKHLYIIDNNNNNNTKTILTYQTLMCLILNLEKQAERNNSDY